MQTSIAYHYVNFRRVIACQKSDVRAHYLWMNDTCDAYATMLYAQLISWYPRVLQLRMTRTRFARADQLHF